jgi:hypothetical protein
MARFYHDMVRALAKAKPEHQIDGDFLPTVRRQALLSVAKEGEAR